MVTDFDGDGRSDSYELRAGEGIFVNLSNGKSFSAGSFWYPDADWTAAWLYAGDFNGDGRTDLVRASAEGAQVLLSDGSEFVAPGDWSTDNVISASPLLTGDFNGDGKADLLIARDDGTGVDMMLSNGDGFGPRIACADTDVSDFANWADPMAPRYCSRTVADLLCRPAGPMRAFSRVKTGLLGISTGTAKRIFFATSPSNSIATCFSATASPSTRPEPGTLRATSISVAPGRST